MSAIVSAFRRFHDFSGRSSRAEYWLFWLFCAQGNVAFAMAHRIAQRVEAAAPYIAMAETAFAALVFIPGLAVGVRRLHDSNRSGWWLALPYAVLLAGSLAFLMFQRDAFALRLLTAHGIPAGDQLAQLNYAAWLMAPLLLSVVLPTWLASLVTFAFHVQRGTPGANRFGPPLAALPVVEDAPLEPAPEPAAPLPHARRRQKTIYAPPSRPAPPPFEMPRPAFGKRL